MFANKISTVSGHPFCPMQTCGQPILPGTGDVFTIAPKTADKLHRLGILETSDTLVIVHKECS